MVLKKEHREVVKAILANVSPTQESKNKLNTIQSEILKKIKVPGATPTLGGSGAKNTWLGETHDIDIYVKFNHAKYKNKSEELSDILHKYLKKSFTRPLRIHGSRDYFQISHKGYTVEIVPTLAITKPGQSKNITDFSFLHVKYVTGKIRKKPALANEIRVAKKFSKANRFYGAESHIGGLSGYVLEILISHYGSFLNFINAASKWKSTTILGDKKKAERLTWSKKISPLIIIDPVQPERNTAAALSKEQYQNIIGSCKEFLKKPSESHFEIKPVNVNKMQKKGILTMITAKPITAKRDIAGAKAKKAFEYLIRNLQPFEVADSFFEYNDLTAEFYIVTKKDKLPKDYKHKGPPIKEKKACIAFKKAYKNSRIKTDKKEKRLYIIKKTKNPELRNYLKKLLTSEEISSRIRDTIILE
jgi:tRNA nucleotidyltransferase (CCA-adding enzyme)